MKVVILAGGSGERFWPLSTPDNPKQFLKLFGGKTLLRSTFERFSSRIDPSEIFVVTNEKYSSKVMKELPEIPRENVIAEPLKKNTAPAITLAAVQIEGDYEMFVAPADHYIPDVNAFWTAVEKGLDYLRENPTALLTFGIVPTRPETGYGYIERGRQVRDGIYKVEMFREKPSYEVAEDFVQSGRFFWNSGMFLWKRETFLKEMEKHAPQILKPIHEKGKRGFEEVPSISIDYALMEKSENVYVVEAPFEWSDVGNWESLKDLGYSGAEILVRVDSENVYAISKKPVLVVGVSDVIVVEGDEGILVVRQGEMEKIREGVRKVFRILDRRNH